MDFAFCTIITSDYIHYALALHKSLSHFGNDVKLYILISDGNEMVSRKIEEKYPGIFIVYSKELCASGIGKNIYEKYYDEDISAFRWSMKPVLINYLLELKDYQKIIYLDADIYFYNDYNFLLDELDIYNVSLTPHWRSPDPHTDLINFGSLYKEGIFNGGFIGVNKKGKDAMDWFAKVCEFICINDSAQVMYYDQLHLNMLPVYFDKVGIIKHKGCNVANWNMVECKRSLAIDKQRVLIANEFPIVFIHFSKATVNGIIGGADPLLVPYLEDYYKVLNQYATEQRTSDKGNTIESGNARIRGKGNDKDHPVETERFLNIAFNRDTLDDFYVRNSIFNSVKDALVHFRGNILDIGPAETSYKDYILQNASVTGYINLDIQNALQENQDNKPGLNWNGITIPFKNEEFKTIIGLEVLDRHAKPEIVIKEANRILQAGGTFFFTVTFLSPLNGRGDDKFRYTPISLKRLLEEAGFVNIEIKAMGGWHASMAQMLGLWVRRSPMSRQRKKILSVVLKPVIKYLIKIDRFTKLDFSKSQMVTGLSGIAYKGS